MDLSVAELEKYGLVQFPMIIGGVVPVPFLLIVGGLALGLLLAALSRAFAGVGARRRASAVEAKLREAISLSMYQPEKGAAV